MKIIKAEKQFRDNTKTKLFYIPDRLEHDDIVEDIVVSWAEQEPAGYGSSYEVYWDEVKDKATIRKCLAQEIDEARSEIRRLKDKEEDLIRHRENL